MTSLRNNAVEEPTAERLLTAARECVLAVGWKRTTLTQVAHRAGVSRMTVYRTYDDMPSLFADLLTREWTDVVGRVVSEDHTENDWPERIALRLAGTVAALRENELMRQMIDLDPEWVLPYLFDRRGRSQDAVLELLATRIAEAQAEGAVRDGDPTTLARSLVLAAHGFTLSIHTMADGIGVEALDVEFVELVRRYLSR